MEKRKINGEIIESFVNWLRDEERGEGTVEKYRRDITAFSVWLDGRSATRELGVRWREQLLSRSYAPVTVNSMLAALNTFYKFAGWDDCRVRTLRLQRRMFRDRSRTLTRSEYVRLFETAERLGKQRLSLLMETICATGIRVSEVKFITVEAAREGRAEVSLKGKIRTILIPGKLARKLVKYAKAKKIASGEIFITGSGRGMSRHQIWAEMKSVCQAAGVEQTKVFPHNLRHLFATTFYRIYKDVVRLADVLGHSSIETTRIYLITPGDEHARQMDKLGLVI